MKSLDDIVREAATRGWLSGTKIHLRHDGKWEVATPSRFEKGAWAIEVSTDPVEALRNALSPYGEPEGAPSIEEMLE